MLRSLTIQNVVLIEKLEIDFSCGLCALTGETGAGKSILLDSLGLALGARAESRLVRRGADKAQVIASFDVAPTHKAFAVLEDAEFTIDPSEGLVLRRTLSTDGKSKAYINDQPAGAALLKAVGDTLVEIHGQFDTHALLKQPSHIGMLDEFAGLESKAVDLQARFNAWKSARQELASAENTAEKFREEEEYLRHVTDELINLNPYVGEEKELQDLKLAIQNRDTVIEALNAAHGYLTAEDSADAMIQKAYRVIGRSADKIGKASEEIMEAMDRASVELESARVCIDAAFADLDDVPHNFADVDDRLYAIRAAARKHECKPDDLDEKLTELEARLATIEAQDDILSELSRKVDASRQSYEALAEEISTARVRSATQIDQEVMAELVPLKLEKARFFTQVMRRDEGEWNGQGIDRVEFLIATNPGADPSPLTKIASGGEMARFMLALKVVMAAVGSAETLIFDEVDTGIGGAVADAVGERLCILAKTHQVMVVTHSPQVAARGNNHWIVHKSGEADVRTSITPLKSAQERREEIARMLSGAQITIEARAAADKLLEKAA
ncbi:MAG: DNA repair protein RecN [Micavibrio sp.]|nr:DNA repair protein RecN [Micavibrio sp.]